MATVPKCKFDLEVCGGTFVNEPCVIDGNLISGRTYHDHGHYIGPWMKLLDAARGSEWYVDQAANRNSAIVPDNELAEVARRRRTGFACRWLLRV